MNLQAMLCGIGRSGGRAAMIVSLAAGAWLTAAAPAMAGDVDLEFTTPTNRVATDVSVRIGSTVIRNINIPAGTSAERKRDLILAAIAGNPVPKFTVEKKGDAGLTIKNLTKGTNVEFRPGMTGEEKEEATALLAPAGNVGFGSSVFASVDADGDPSTFTAGFLTDVGRVEVTLSALDLAALDGASITAAMFDELAPSAADFGASVLNLGTELAFTFDPRFTQVVGGGVIFGTTALSDGVFGSIVVGVPEPASLALAGLGLAALGLGARRRKFTGAMG